MHVTPPFLECSIKNASTSVYTPFFWCPLLDLFRKEKHFSDSQETNLFFLWSHPSQESCRVTSAGVLRRGGVVWGVDRHRLSVRLSSPGRAPGPHTSPFGRSTHDHAARCGEETVAFVSRRNITWPHLLPAETDPAAQNENYWVVDKKKVVLCGRADQISKTDVLKVSWELLWDRQTDRW